MSSTTHPLRSLFLNCHGLNPVKFDKLESLVLQTPPIYDFIFVAETWFRELPRCRASPAFVTHSPPPPSSARIPRGQGGLMCLAPPSHHSALANISSTPYSITIHLPLVCLHIIYLPPSLITKPGVNLLTICQPPRTPAVLFGDFNCRLGKNSGDTVASAPEVKRILGLIGQQYHLRRVVLQGKITRTDHVYASAPTHCDVIAIDPPVETDHPSALSFTTTTPIAENPNTLRRFYLKHLDDPLNVFRIQEAWEELGPKLSLAITSTKLPSLPTLPQRQAYVDACDALLLEACLTIAEDCIGSYEVAEARKRVDRSLEKIARVESPSEALRIFRRSCRTKPTVRIESRSPETSIIQDATNFYQETNRQPSPSLHPNNTPENLLRWEGYPGSTVLTSEIWEEIRAYPSQ